MSYAIIRVEKHKRGNLKLADKHDERKNTNYSNKNIDISKSYLNYHLKKPKGSYEREFERIRKENNLKGQIKEVSNIACEYLITSDKEFFDAIGEKETKRYFQTAFDFTCNYKNLGKENIISAVVHLDEETPHLHLVFIPVIHTQDKKGNDIDKIACSEFWKGYDSFRDLQDNFYQTMKEHGFDLERGQTSHKKHLTVQDYKEITNFDKTIKELKDISLDIPQVPNIKDFNKIMFNRDEKIQKEIIEPKDNAIKDLYSDNVKLKQELSKQVKVVEKAELHEKEHTKLVKEKQAIQNKYDKLENSFDEKISKIEHKYNKNVSSLEKEITYLNRLVNTMKNTVSKFITWVCSKFSVAVDVTIRDFEKENNLYLTPEKQIQKEDYELERQIEDEWEI